MINSTFNPTCVDDGSVNEYVYVYMSVCMYACMYVCVCMYIRVYVCICVCVFLFLFFFYYIKHAPSLDSNTTCCNSLTSY